MSAQQDCRGAALQYPNAGRGDADFRIGPSPTDAATEDWGICMKSPLLISASIMEASSSHENPPLGREAHALQHALGNSLAEDGAE